MSASTILNRNFESNTIYHEMHLRTPGETLLLHLAGKLHLSSFSERLFSVFLRLWLDSQQSPLAAKMNFGCTVGGYHAW